MDSEPQASTLVVPPPAETGDIDLFEVGQVVGSYRLLDILGEGAVGRVFLAEHVSIGRRVALKMLRREHASNPVTLRRFFGEARAVNQIAHEHIVSITDFFEGDVEQPSYFIMELLEGHTLADAIRRGVLPLSRSLDVIDQIAAALEAVHEKGIVHRDLKPANIFLCDKNGRRDFVKLLDFGVAKLSESARDLKGFETAAGVVVGTPAYMSPEQAGGLPVDLTTDIYALGIMLYELVSGENPFAFENFLESLMAQAQVEPEPLLGRTDLPHRVPPELDALILSCLDKSPEGRPSSIAVFRARLRSARMQSERTTEIWPQASEDPVEPPTAPENMDLHFAEAAFNDAALDTEYVSLGRRRGAAALGLALLATSAFIGYQVMMQGTVEVAPMPVPSTMALSQTVERPVEPPAPEVPEQVMLRFDSAPQGAQVSVSNAGGEHILGITPFVHAMDPSEDALEVRIELEGHKGVSRTLVPKRDVEIFVSLDKEAKPVRSKKKHRRRRARRAPRKAPAKRLDKNAVLDPFAK